MNARLLLAVAALAFTPDSSLATESQFDLALPSTARLWTCSRYVVTREPGDVDGVDFEDAPRSAFYSPPCPEVLPRNEADAQHPRGGFNTMAEVSGSLGLFLFPRVTDDEVREGNVTRLLSRLFPTRLEIRSTDPSEHRVRLGQPNFRRRSTGLVNWVNPSAPMSWLSTVFSHFQAGPVVWYAPRINQRVLDANDRIHPLHATWITFSGLARDLLGRSSSEADELGFGCAIRRENHVKYALGNRLTVQSRIIYRLVDLADPSVPDPVLAEIRRGLRPNGERISDDAWNREMESRQEFASRYRPANGKCAMALRAAQTELEAGVSEGVIEAAAAAVGQRGIFLMRTGRHRHAMMYMRHLEVGMELVAPLPRR
jgi:hypothetical protein